MRGKDMLCRLQCQNNPYHSLLFPGLLVTIIKFELAVQKEGRIEEWIGDTVRAIVAKCVTYSLVGLWVGANPQAKYVY